MPSQNPLSIDVLIFGGGIAGLWLLDELRRRGYRALLAENRALGSGQTIASQGIIHGGLKYMLDGHLNRSARAISAMPSLWRQCLADEIEPNLRGTEVLSDGCFIWGTGSIKSRIFLTGSALALRTAPQPVERERWPEALAAVPGKVLKVAEPVLSPSSLLHCLAERNRRQLLRVEGLPVIERGQAQRALVQLQAPDGRSMHLQPEAIIFAAGEGNQALRERAGLDAGRMQRRPLHMTMVRGQLPKLFGHCVGGPKPRITITTAMDGAGRPVWQIGGQLAEDGVKLDAAGLAKRAADELRACIPGLDLGGVEFATYRVDRAEALTASGDRPDDVHLVREGNVLTAWPTKLALAPRLAERIAAELAPPAADARPEALADWPAPTVAPSPWEVCGPWFAA